MRSFRLMSRLGSASMNTHFRMAPTASLYQTKTMFPVGSLRMFSAGPPPLTVQQIEDRVLQLLKDFDKVEAPKVSEMIMIRTSYSDLNLVSYHWMPILSMIWDWIVWIKLKSQWRWKTNSISRFQTVTPKRFSLPVKLLRK